MPLTSKQRAELRAAAHHLKPVVHVGKDGLTAPVLDTLDDALRTRELIKVQAGRMAGSARDAASEMAEQLHADVVQVIGRTVSLYRENPELERKAGAPPAWSR